VQPLNEIEKEYILTVLEMNAGNQTQSAKQLQIGPATLYRKLKKYGISSPKPGDPLPTGSKVPGNFEKRQKGC
jgi:DNA-binding NtrC family response regulator